LTPDAFVVQLGHGREIVLVQSLQINGPSLQPST
jgi:hypothetical protein